MNLKNLDQQSIDKIFLIYEQVTNKKTNIPALEEIKKSLEKNLPYEFISGGFRWTSKLRFEKQNNKISLEFIYNKDIPKFMVDSLKIMKEDFEKKLSNILQ